MPSIVVINAYRLLSAIPLLDQKLRCLPDSDNLSIAFPDEGAWKRFHSELAHWPTITCIKVRDGDKRVVSIKEGKDHSQVRLALLVIPHNAQESPVGDMW